MNNNEQLDNILDKALGEYREAEPLAGLEDRVLQRLRLLPERRRTASWSWGAVAACAVLLVIAPWLGLGTRRERASSANQAAVQPHAAQTSDPTTAGGETRSKQPSAQREIASDRAATRRDTREHMAIETAGGGVPKTTQFPSPAPLTPEEHALLALASLNPEALLNPSDRSRDLEIAPIEIKPLAGSDVPALEKENSHE